MAQRHTDSRPHPRPWRKWCLLAALLAVVSAALVLWQRNNIQAMIHYRGNTSTQLEQKLEEADRAAEETLNELLSAENTPPPAAMTPAAEQSYMPSATPNPAPQASAPAALPEPTVPVPTSQSDMELALNALIDEIFGLRDHYIGLLDGLQHSAEAEYEAIQKQELTRARKLNLLSSYMAQATALEKECDGKMDRIVREMRKILKAHGKDQTLADEVAYAYANEKSLKKAWYISQAEKKGLI